MLMSFCYTFAIWRQTCSKIHVHTLIINNAEMRAQGSQTSAMILFPFLSPPFGLEHFRSDKPLIDLPGEYAKTCLHSRHVIFSKASNYAKYAMRNILGLYFFFFQRELKIALHYSLAGLPQNISLFKPSFLTEMLNCSGESFVLSMYNF